VPSGATRHVVTTELRPFRRTERIEFWMCGLPTRRPFPGSELFKLGVSLLIGAAACSRRFGGADDNTADDNTADDNTASPCPRHLIALTADDHATVPMTVRGGCDAGRQT